MYTKKLVKLLILGAISFTVGVALYLSMAGQSADLSSALLFGWLFGSIPYGWKLSGRVVPTLISINLPIMFILFICRFLIAAVTGWIAMPIAIIRCTIGAIREKKDNRECMKCY